jgi:hypothetical protein
MCNQNKPHVHAALIKAWADGATIQCKWSDSKSGAPDKWEDLGTPQWLRDCEYRIKPTTGKYRVWLDKEGKTWLCRDEHDAVQAKFSENFDQFITEWVEYDL